MLRARRRGKWNGAPAAGAGRRRLNSKDEAENTLSVEEGRIVAAVVIGGRAITATVDTGATCSCVSEDCVRRQATRGEIQEMQSRIRLADGSALEITKRMNVEVGLAGKVVKMTVLVMPAMLEHLILGMDF
ncbi:hypothetical protein AWZ03_015166 [Drosophila navojoa]|uniref:Peptidase A2 domain-containing protein n=1 Tax=Drosophila navojoa TaxID=7232 RepID=A0A484AS34_DRONA|nr:hypothetical protein AWZ03_015166 [Drosophila navojoa]